MGNSNSKQNQQLFQHPRLGNIKLNITENSEKQKISLIQYTKPVNNQSEYIQWMKSKQMIQNAQIRQVLFLPIKSSYEKQGFCGSSGHAILIFQDYLFVLENQIRNRERIQKRFLEVEIWYLLYNIVRAGKQFQKNQKKVGDIQPFNIVINQDGQIKVVSSISFPNELNNFQKIVQNRNSKVYLAPQECNQQFIKKAQYPKRINKNVAQTFTIGVTILQAAILKDCEELYIKNPELKFDYQRLDIFKQILRGTYSDLLIKTIENMLQINVLQRPTCGQIYAVLYPYENQILNLEQFEPNKMESQKSLLNYKKIQSKNNIVDNNYYSNNFSNNSMNYKLNNQTNKNPTRETINSNQYQNLPVYTSNKNVTNNVNVLPRYQTTTNTNLNRTNFTSNRTSSYQGNTRQIPQQQYNNQFR